ncbi:conserved hypothetical protein [Trichinella spiralis]|uniref:hypothetical protein n=1 Tax=Trichinella spiralis TaxID=6334 RepID=UPI0001EFD334|nr:conserved hypothetical protein [Trichinella spiralis]
MCRNQLRIMYVWLYVHHRERRRKNFPTLAGCHGLRTVVHLSAFGKTGLNRLPFQPGNELAINDDANKIFG